MVILFGGTKSFPARQRDGIDITAPVQPQEREGHQSCIIVFVLFRT